MEFKSTEEARKWLAGKRWVNDEYDKLNRKLVELRISTGERSKSIDFPFAYLDPNGDLTHISYVNINEWRSLSKYEIITSQDILSITIKDESRFKDGDILYAESNTPGTGWTIIFNPITIDEDCYKKGQLSYYAMLGAAGEILFDFHCDPAGFQLATEAQKERLFSALCKQNKMWDPIEKKITRWRPNMGEVYDSIFLGDKGPIIELEVWDNGPFDWGMFSSNNCYPSEYNIYTKIDKINKILEED